MGLILKISKISKTANTNLIFTINAEGLRWFLTSPSGPSRWLIQLNYFILKGENLKNKTAAEAEKLFIILTVAGIGAMLTYAFALATL